MQDQHNKNVKELLSLQAAAPEPPQVNSEQRSKSVAIPPKCVILITPKSLPLPPMPYETATTRAVRANNRFRVALDGNRYSVPSEYAGARLSMKVFANRLCLYHDGKLIAKHTRSYDKNQDIEDPDHPRALLQQRRAAREQRLLMRFLTISAKAEQYYQELAKRRMNPRHHIRQILALSEIYGVEKLSRATGGNHDGHKDQA